MLDVHPPHAPTHTWRDFIIHIATIVIGLIIAVGLEQSVEFVHHRHQLADLREQMHDVLENNLQGDAQELKFFAGWRASLLDLRARIDAPPHSSDTSGEGRRITVFLRIPSVAPYEAAKENGTVALLSGDEIRLYNRISFQRDLLLVTVSNWGEANRELDIFEERFLDSPVDSLFPGPARPNIDLSQLSSEQREHYRLLIATAVKDTDLVATRMAFFDGQCRAILDGVRDENILASPKVMR
jgi:hypothetical protein